MLLWFSDFLAQYSVTIQKQTYVGLQSHSGVILKDSDEGKSYSQSLPSE